MSNEPPAPLPRSIISALPAAVEINRLLHAVSALIAQDLRDQLIAAEMGGALQLARAFVALHRLHDKVEGCEKAFSKVFEDYKVNRVPESFEDEGMKNAPLVEGFRVDTSLRLYASIRKGMLPDAIKYCRDTNLPNLIDESINANSLSAALGREIKESSKEPPREIFNLNYKVAAKVAPLKSKTLTPDIGD